MSTDFTHPRVSAMTRSTDHTTTKITIPMIREVRGMFALFMSAHHPR